MTLPNVNEWMTSLSALQIVPPPKHERDLKDAVIGNGKEPSVPPMPAAYYPEQRDDLPSTDRSASKRSGEIKSTRKSPVKNNEATTAKKRQQTSISRKRGEEISIPIPTTRSPTPNSDSSSKQKSMSESSKQRSMKNISNLLSTDKTNKQYGNMIMVGTQRVYPRTLVQPTIYHNEATDLWIATIHTDHHSVPTASDISTAETKSNDKAFSFNDERSARASAYANSPPVMVLPTGKSSQCMLCDTSFTFLRRPKHCKNCGIIICGDCCTRWNTKMLPETYTSKSTLGLSKTVRVCVSCDAVAKRFKNALMMGRYDVAIEGYLTGNVNLRCPFVFKGEKEIMFPIHCAILGQSERLLRWLVDVQCCPVHLTSTANKGKKSYEEDVLPTLQTSKGRSVMDIAMEMKHVGILKYLVKEKGVSAHEVKDLALALGALENMIMAFPEDVDDSDEKEDGFRKKETAPRKIKSVKSSGVSKRHREKATTPQPHNLQHPHLVVAYTSKDKTLLPRDIQPATKTGLYGNIGRCDSDDEKNDVHGAADSDDDCSSVCTTMTEMCIVCNEAPIDCVATPCGHQVCCMSCTKDRIACPSCKVVCQFIEIYQP